MTQHVVVLLIMDMESAKSDVNGPKKKTMLLGYFNKKGQKHQLKKCIDPNCIELDLSFKK